MSTSEFFDRLCQLLCELDKLVKTYFFGKAQDCKMDCGTSRDDADAVRPSG